MQNDSTFEETMARFVGERVADYLINSNVVIEKRGESLIWVQPMANRVLIAINPAVVKNVNALASVRTQHALTTLLQGRRVVVSAGRGFFIQVAYTVETFAEIASKPLDLSYQKSPTHVPIGAWYRGQLWMPLEDLDAVLIGGSRRMGKTNIVHTWIQALIHGQSARLVMYDGKGGLEFNQYRGVPRIQVVNTLVPALDHLRAEMDKRFEQIGNAGAKNVGEYNHMRDASAHIERIVLVVDELRNAFQEDDARDLLIDLINRGGAAGVHPVLATQHPSADVVSQELKANCSTRIALRVPDNVSSRVILDRTGAEKLPAVKGRLLMAHGPHLIEAQAFIAPEFDRGKNLTALMPAHPQLSDAETRMLAAAKEMGTWKSEDVARAVGTNKNTVNDVAQRLELLGFLKRGVSERGHRLGRQLTPQAMEILGAQ